MVGLGTGAMLQQPGSADGAALDAAVDSAQLLPAEPGMPREQDH